MLTSREHALELLAAGETVAETSRRAGVSVSTIQRWKKEPAFAAALNVFREANQAAMERHPSVRATLELALRARRPDGHPDWATRVAAAGKLSALPPDPTDHTPEAVMRVRRELLEEPDAWGAAE